MSMSKDIQSSLNNNPKASFSLSSMELRFSLLVGVATALGLISFINSELPLSCGPDISYSSINCDYTWTPQLAWELRGRPLFLTYIIPYVLSLAISGIFLLRSIRRDVRQFSMIANLAFSFPALAFIGLLFHSIVSWYFSVLGVVLAILAAFNTVRSQDRERDWLSLPFNLVWIVIFQMFVFHYLRLYSD
jgi:hypothetical protein